MINLIILAAGRGSRLKKTTKSIPKGLVKIRNNKTILDFQIEILKKIVKSKIIIVTGFQKNKLIRKFNKENFLYVFNKNWNKTNMMYSLYCADKYLKKNPCIVLYSDIIYSKNIISKMIKNKKDLSLAYDINWLSLWKSRFDKPELDAESFFINKKNKITEIGKKVSKKELKNIKGQYMGIVKIYPQAWELIKKKFTLAEIKNNHLTHILDKIINNKIMPVYGVKNTDAWYEIDNNKDLRLARKNINRFT
jgi:L-glutamine-phosphate cytidylyltransferase